MSIKIEKGGGLPDFGDPVVEKGKEKENKSVEVATAALSELAKKIQVQSQEKPLIPIKTNTANNVYINDIVFKPGFESGWMAEICDGFVQQVPGLKNVVAPAILDKLTVIAKIDVDKHYEIIPHGDGELLVKIGAKIKIKDIEEKEDGSLSVKIKGERFYLIPSEDTGLYDLKPEDAEDELDELEADEEDEDEELDELKPGPTKKEVVISESESDDDDFFNDFNRLEERSYVEKEDDDDFFNDFNRPEEGREEVDSDIGSSKNEGLEESFSDEEEFSEEEVSPGVRYVIIRNQSDSGSCIVSEDDHSSIVIKDNEKYVLRDGLYYNVEQEKDQPTYRVIGKGIAGMVQEKVQNICNDVFARNRKTGIEEELPVDVRVDSPQRDEFFKRVSMPHFIKAYVASMIFRSQDEKVTALTESNVLFTYLPDKEGQIDKKNALLAAVLIDLDQTFPPNNKISTDPDKPAGVHPIRNGLLGFPQVRNKLTEEEMGQTLEIMKELIDKKNDLVEYLGQFVKSEETVKEEVSKKILSMDQINAFVEVIDGMDTFIQQHRDQNDWTLEDLFFFVFPEYKEQWDKLPKLNPGTRAEWIGFYNPEEMSRLYQRYA